jgi:hypothetical protein
LRYLNPDFPRTIAARSISTSGIPKANRPESVTFQPDGRDDDMTTGMRSGTNNAKTKIDTPRANRLCTDSSVVRLLVMFIGSRRREMLSSIIANHLMKNS